MHPVPSCHHLVQGIATQKGPAELFDEVGPSDYDAVVARLAAVKEQMLMLLVHAGIPVNEYMCASGIRFVSTSLRRSGAACGSGFACQGRGKRRACLLLVALSLVDVLERHDGLASRCFHAAALVGSLFVTARWACEQPGPQ